jgi:hypothetical protein
VESNEKANGLLKQYFPSVTGLAAAQWVLVPKPSPNASELQNFQLNKFPDSREIAWRRVRSALRRQPSSPRFGEFSSLVAGRLANGGLF